MKYKGNWSYATTFDDRCENNGIIATADLPVDERVRLITEQTEIWKKMDAKQKPANENSEPS